MRKVSRTFFVFVFDVQICSRLGECSVLERFGIAASKIHVSTVKTLKSIEESAHTSTDTKVGSRDENVSRTARMVSIKVTAR